ncbi:MAG: type II secretion system F family protein [Betaproteobacteria bacterium]|nr:type II secretion system F family protein [Betaproteobacteria bacterium]
MPQFAYKARNAVGEPLSGHLEGSDSAQVADLLFSRDLTPVEIVGVPDRPSAHRHVMLGRLFAPQISVVDLMLFSRQMHTLLKAGVPILQALAGLQRSSSSPALNALLRDISDSLDMGRELSAAMRRHPEVFSPLYISMIRAGELTGTLDRMFLQLFAHLQFEKEMGERIRQALRYPSFVVAAMAVAVIVINVLVVPSFAKAYQNFHAALPIPTRALIACSHFLLDEWLWLAAAAAGLAGAAHFYLKTPQGRFRWDRLKLRLPLAGKIILKGILARFARTFALTLRSGIPVVHGLAIAAQVVDNAFLTQRVEQMRDGVARGESISRTALAADIFTPVVLQMMIVGEESGELDDLMQEISEMYEREVDYEVKTLSTQIEPILVIGLGVLVLVLALSVFLPMWDLGRAALHQ